MTNNGETSEQIYRRAYRDGWIEALNAIHELMFEQRKSRDVAHQICWDHCQEVLSDWQDRSKDLHAKYEGPPAINLKG